MSMIKCIECGNNISSLAEACPFCGCPAKHQKTNSQQVCAAPTPAVPPSKPDISYLKYPGLWGEIRDAAIVHDFNNANRFTKKLTGKPITSELYYEIIKIKDLPIEMIIKTYPEQASRPYNEAPTTLPCKACGKTISVKAEVCPHCGEPTGVHVCPKCGNTDVWVLDAVTKTLSLVFMGPLAVNTVRSKYECKKCHFKF